MLGNKPFVKKLYFIFGLVVFPLVLLANSITLHGNINGDKNCQKRNLNLLYETMDTPNVDGLQKNTLVLEHLLFNKKTGFELNLDSQVQQLELFIGDKPFSKEVQWLKDQTIYKDLVQSKLIGLEDPCLYALVKWHEFDKIWKKYPSTRYSKLTDYNHILKSRKNIQKVFTPFYKKAYYEHRSFYKCINLNNENFKSLISSNFLNQDFWNLIQLNITPHII